MGFLGFLGATLILALALSARCYPARPGEDGGERSVAVFLLWFAILIGLDWALAALRLLAAPGLYGGAIACALGGGALLMADWRRSGARWRPLGGFTQRLAGLPPVLHLALAVAVLSVIYVVARGLILGGWATEFDALSYHFPKAVEICRAHTIPRVLCGDFRIPYFPWDYELLLADGLLLTPGDYLSFLVPLLAYGGFGATLYAFYRRAWPGTRRADLALGVLLALATPILIMHISANKNDLLAAFFQMAFLFWSTLWYLDGGRREGALALLSLALFFGTKTTALFLGPWLLVMVWRRWSWFGLRALGGGRKVLAAGALAVLALALMGAAWPLLNLAWTGKFFGDVAQAGGISSFEANAAPHYNGISNIWRFTVLVFMKPFSSNPLAVWVPWARQYWFWPSYRLIYGHFGWLCTVLLLLLPMGVRRNRRSKDGAAPFRLAATVGILSCVVFTLPQQYRVDGMFCGAPRYLLCIPVLVVLWTAVPLLSWLREHGRLRVHGLLALGAVAYFGGQNWIYLTQDEARSWDQVVDVASRPQDVSWTGVAYIFDRNAGPRDAVALDGGFGALFYPIYGRKLERPVSFLLPGPLAIPAQVKWVVIDRSWNMGWSHPGATSTSEYLYPTNGQATPQDATVFLQLSRDPQWQLVFMNKQRAEAVFLRKTMAASG